MFGDIFGMIGNYEARKVDRFEGEDGFFISTAEVTDSPRPFETAVAHPNYYDGEILIVECYDTREEAQTGHDLWVEKMTADVLPESLTDVGESGIAQLVEGLGLDREFPNEPTDG